MLGAIESQAQGILQRKCPRAWKLGSKECAGTQRCPLVWLSFGKGGGDERNHMFLSQESSAQGLSEAFQRLMLSQPVHLGWYSLSVGSEDILNVSKMTNVEKCH